MTAARSLDEVIEVHELYLLTIQRQCFVVPDKLVGSLSCLRTYEIIFYALRKAEFCLLLSFASVGSHSEQD